VQKLHLVGFTTDLEGLIFSARKGAKSGGFLVPLDDQLLGTIAEAERIRNGESGDKRKSHAGEQPRHDRPTDSRLTPREIQARLRGGQSIAEVAAEARVDPEWVERFAVPVVAEQARMVGRARSSTYSKARLGQSTQDLATSVRWNLADKGGGLGTDVFDEGWGAFQVQGEIWMVRFRYTSRGRQQLAEWEFDAGAGNLTARNRLASELGYVEKGRRRPTMAPPPAPPPPPPPPPPPVVLPIVEVVEVVEEPEPETAKPSRPTRRASAKKGPRRRPAAKRATTRAAPAKAKKRAAPRKGTARKTTSSKAAAGTGGAGGATAKKRTVARPPAKRAAARRPSPPAAPPPATAPPVEPPKKAARKATARKSPARNAIARRTAARTAAPPAAASPTAPRPPKPTAATKSAPRPLAAATKSAPRPGTRPERRMRPPETPAPASTASQERTGPGPLTRSLLARRLAARSSGTPRVAGERAGGPVGKRNRPLRPSR